MPFYPNLDRKLLPTENVRYLATYGCDETRPENPKNDPLHIHSCYEIYVNLGGDVSFLVNDTLFPVKRGSVILSKPGDVHRCVYNAACRHEHYCVWIDADAPFLSFISETEASHSMLLEEKELMILDGFLTVLTERSIEGIESCAAFFGMLALLFGKNRVIMPPSETLPPAMRQILAHINRHFAEISSVATLCEKWYISPATLNRWFHQYIKTSPQSFLQSKKLAFSQSLLREGASVTEAAFQSGFSDVSYFIAVFKKRFGVTPAVYGKGTALQDI